MSRKRTILGMLKRGDSSWTTLCLAALVTARCPGWQHCVRTKFPLEAFWTQNTFLITIAQCLVWVVDRPTCDVKAEEEGLRGKKGTRAKG